MKKTLKLRLIFWIWGTTIILFSILTYINYTYSRNEVEAYIKENAYNIARYYAKNFEYKFSRTAIIPEMAATHLKTSLRDSKEGEIKEYLLDILEENPHIYGSCIAFEPYEFNQEKEFFAPYYYFKDKKPAFVELGEKKNYDYLNQSWYTSAKEKGEPLWSEPYFDTGGGDTVMITYSVPFYYNSKFKGVVTADLCLKEMNEEIRKEDLLISGYIFIVSKEGAFLSCPDKKEILKGNIYNYDKQLASLMTSGEEGFIEAKDPFNSDNSWISFYPVKSSGFSIAVVYPEDEVMMAVYNLQKENIITASIGLIILLIIIILISNSIVRPLSSFVEDVNKLSYGELDQAAPLSEDANYNLTSFLRNTHDVSHRISVNTPIYEVRALETSFNNMICSLKKYIHENQSITAEKERMEKELSIAREIQMSVSPRKFPAFPDRKDIDIFGKTSPAKEVGGDFYDFFLIDEEHLGFLIGDAAGKGVPAAIFMAVSRAFLKATALKGYKPGECLKDANNLLCSEDYMDMFITVFYGILNTSTGKLVYSNGGHNPPYLIKDGTIENLEIASGPALGIFDGADYKTVETVMEKGNGLFLYTDGVDEAFDPEENLFTSERLEKILKEMEDFSPQKSIRKIYREVKKFAKGAPQADDITMVAIKHIGN